MAKSRPAGGRAPGRRGGAGTGPRGPVKTGGTGKGISHKSSSSISGTGPIILVWSLLLLPLLTGVTVVGYLLHGHGVI